MTGITGMPLFRGQHAFSRQSTEDENQKRRLKFLTSTIGLDTKTIEKPMALKGRVSSLIDHPTSDQIKRIASQIPFSKPQPSKVKLDKIFSPIGPEDFKYLFLYGDTKSSPYRTAANFLAGAILENVHDDKGRTLEGAIPKRMFQMTSKLMEYVAQHYPQFVDPKMPINKFLQDLEGAEQIANLIDSIVQGHSSVDDVAQECMERVKHLKNGESLLFPWGWLNPDGGHAMTLEVIRKGDEYSLKIYNAGDGVQYHLQSLDTVKSKIDPTMIFEGIPLRDLNIDFFRAFIDVSSKGTSIQPYKAKDIYKAILTRFESYKIERKDPRYTIEQRSGNCTAKSIMLYLHEHSEHSSYKKLKILMQLSLIEVINKLDDPMLKDQAMRDILHRTLQNISRQLEEISLINPKDDRFVRGLILQIKDLDRKIPQPRFVIDREDKFKVNRADTLKMIDLSNNMDNIEQSATKRPDDVKTKAVKEIPIPLKNMLPGRIQDPQEAVDCLSNFLRELNSTKDSIYFSSLFTSKHIVKFIQELPLSSNPIDGVGEKDVWEMLSLPQCQEAQESLRNLMTELLAAYNKIYVKQISKDEIVAFHKIYAIMWKIVANKEELMNVPSELRLSSYGPYDGYLKGLDEYPLYLAFNSNVKDINIIKSVLKTKEGTSPLFDFTGYVQNGVAILPPPNPNGDSIYLQNVCKYLEAKVNDPKIWEEIDQLKETISFQRKVLIELKDFRLAALWLESYAPKINGQSFPSSDYYCLRDMMLTILHASGNELSQPNLSFYNSDRTSQLIHPVDIEDLLDTSGDGNRKIYVKIQLKKDVRSLSVNDPFDHQIRIPLLFNEYSSLAPFTWQNDWGNIFRPEQQNPAILNSKGLVKTISTICNEKKLSIYRILQEFRENPQLVADPFWIQMLETILFGFNELKEVLKNKYEAEELLGFFKREMPRLISLVMKENVERSKYVRTLDDVPKEFIFLRFVHSYLRTIDYSIRQGQLSHDEADKIKNDIRSLLYSIEDRIPEDNRQWLYRILLSSYSEYCDGEELEEIVTIRTKLNRFESKEEIFCDMSQMSYSSMYNHIEQFQTELQDPERCDQICQAICRANRIKDTEKLHWNGEFPFYTCNKDDNEYIVNIIEGRVWMNKREISRWNPKYNIIIGELSKNIPFDSIHEIATPGGYNLYELKNRNGNLYRVYHSISQDDHIERIQEDRAFVLCHKVNQADLPKFLSSEQNQYHFWFSKDEPRTLLITDRMTQEICYRVEGANTVVFGKEKDKWKLAEGHESSHLRQFGLKGDLHTFVNENTSRIRIVSSRFQDVMKRNIEFEEEWISPTEKKFIYKNDPMYSLARDQTFIGPAILKDCLVLEETRGGKKGHRKALIPLLTYESAKKSSSFADRGTSCVIIDMDNEGHLRPNKRIEALYIAYYSLASRDYLTAFNTLRDLQDLTAFSVEEHKILALIVNQKIETHDSTPEASAVKALAAWKVHENLRIYPLDKNEELQTEITMEVGPFPIPNCEMELFRTSFQTSSNTSWDWKKYWNLAPQDVQMVLSAYYNNQSNIPRNFWMHSPEGFLSLYQEADFLSDKINNLNLYNRFLALFDQKLDEKKLSFSAEEDIDADNKIRFKSFFSYGVNLWKRGVSFDEMIKKIPSLRLGNALKENLGDLLHFSQYGTLEEKKRINNLLEQSKFESLSDDTHLIIRTILWILTLEEYKDDRKMLDDLITNLIRYLSVNTQDLEYLYNNALKARKARNIGHVKSIEVSKDVSNIIALGIPSLPKSVPKKMTLDFADETINDTLQQLSDKYFEEIKKGSERKEMEPLSSALKNNEGLHRNHQRLIDDLEKGSKQNDNRQTFKWKEGQRIDEFMKEVKMKAKDLHQKSDELSASINNLLHKYPKSPVSTDILRAHLSQLGLKDIPLGIAQLIPLFLHADLDQYKKMLPYLSEEEIKRLHNQVCQYFYLQVCQQRLKRAEKIVEKIDRQIKKGKIEKAEHIRGLLGATLNQHIEYDPKAWPEILLFEYSANVSLREDQVMDLQKLLDKNVEGNFKSIIIQRMMAAGKTFVLGTILAHSKADGYHLSILIPPTSLFETNAQDLEHRTWEFYGQKAHPIVFSRGSKYYNVVNLRWIKATVLNSIRDREYILMSPETAQALQNKYIEQQFKEDFDENDPCFVELGEILKLFKERGVATFDEIDTTYDPFKEFNFPTEKKEAPDNFSCELIAELFYITATDPEIIGAGLNLLANQQNKFTDYEKIKPILIDRFMKKMYHNNAWKNQLSLFDPVYVSEAKLKDFLLGPTGVIPEWIHVRMATSQGRKGVERLLLLKQELDQGLRLSWQKSADEHYGRSLKFPEYELAKPNIAANTPNERSEFSDRWETVNKTCHLYLYNGLTFDQTKKFIKFCQEQSILLAEAGKGQVKPPLISDFEELLKGEKRFKNLETMDLNSSEVIDIVQKRLNNKSPVALRLVMMYVTNVVFPKSKFYVEQIHNNSQNLGSIFQSVQGYSGTIENPYIYPDLIERIEPDVGSNGRIIDVLLRENRTVHVVDQLALKPKELLQKILTDTKTNQYFHALIDTGAYFKPYSNKEVAHSILDFFLNEPESKINGVLFYDQQTNLLACLLSNGEVKILPDTFPETIKAVTGLKRDQLFTYFDQYHCTGSNILQVDDARAVATVDSANSVRDILQGVMRMRKLLENQHVEFVVTEAYCKYLRDVFKENILKPSVDQIIIAAEHYANQRQIKENAVAAMQKIHHLVRQMALGLFPFSTDTLKKFPQLKEIFIRRLDVSFYERLSKVKNEQTSREFLIDYSKDLLDILRPLLNEENEKSLISQLAVTLQNSFEQIQMKLPKEAFDQQRDSTVEQQMQSMQKLEQQQQQEVRTTNSWVQVEPFKEEKLQKMEINYVKYPDIPFTVEGMVVWSIQDVISGIPNWNRLDKETALGMSKALSNIQVSMNFAQTRNYSVCSLLDEFQKTPYEILVVPDEEGRRNVILVSLQEAGQLLAQKDTWPWKGAMLMEPTGHVIAPYNTTIDLNDRELLKMLIQVLFIAGSVPSLIKIANIQDRDDPWRIAFYGWVNENKSAAKRILELALKHREENFVIGGTALEAALA